MIDLSKVIESATELEPLPATATRLADLLTREDSTFEEIEHTVSLDPALTGRLLRFANSSETAGLAAVSTVHGAVSRLGTGAVLSLAVGSIVHGLMRRSAADTRHENSLWCHSVTAALAARDLAHHGRHQPPAEAFTGALLHDIGKLVLSRFLAPQVRRVLADAGVAGLTPLEAEREVLGVDHAEVGALVAEHWKLPDPLVSAIRFHHRPFEGPHPACWAVAAANWAAHPEQVTPWEIASLEVPLGLTPVRFQALCREVREGRDAFLGQFEAACSTS